MIDKSALTAVLERGMEGTDLFLVDVRISKDNNIVVEIDSDTSVDIDECIRLNRLVEIGAAGLTSPLRVERQYHKNEGNEVEVLTADGRKLKGTLKRADADGFVLTVVKKVKPEGAKRPVEQEEDLRFGYNEIKYTKYVIQF